jgi:hypothetical protein
MTSAQASAIRWIPQPGLCGAAAPRIPGKGGHHDVEGGFSDGWLGEQGQERLELEERARPTVGEDERDSVVASGRGVDEVQVEAVDRGPVVVEGVEPALGGPPVVGGAPVLAEIA